MGHIGLRLLAALSVFASTAANAQYAALQDSTLAGVSKVYLNLQMAESGLPQAQLSQLASTINLELRKSGIKIATDPASMDMKQDALINIGFTKIQRSLSADYVFRMDVEQLATLARTNKTSQMVTWFYEDNQRNVVPEQVAEAMLKRGLDKFLNAWLTANGR